MNGMNFKPFIAKLLDSLSDEQVKSLYDLVNSHSNNFKKRSLIGNSNLLTTSDKGIGLYTIQLDSETIKTGYLIYNDTYCVLLGYVSNSERVSEYVIDMTKKTWSMVKEFITTDYFRHEVAIRAVSVGELVEVEVDDINSDDEAAGKVIVTDGEGGATWQTPDEMAPVGDASYLLGIDSEGNLVKDELPEGIVVDQSVIEDSTNAVSGGAVFDELALKADKSTTYTKTETDALLEEKANVDGNYPTMTVGVADNLSPYDSESGADQDEPFSFQATGTANGTDPTFSTGAYALMKEKQGNSVVVNQLVETNKTLTFDTTDTSAKNIASGLSIPQGHKILIIWNQNQTLTSNVRNTPQIVDGSTVYLSGDENYHLQKGMYYWLYTVSNILTTISYWCHSPDVEVTIDKIYCIDLYQWFNGDIPQDILDNPSNFFRYYQGDLSYNTGTLVNANSQYIKCIGRQQWDEEWATGSGSSSTGVINYDSPNGVCTKNYVLCLPDTNYYVKSPNGIYFYFYDKDKVHINIGTAYYQNQSFKTPSNARYFRFQVANAYGITYNHDITISIYYSGESGYDQYYPYELLTNNDTGTETLRSAGSVRDSKDSSGTITRRIGSYTFTGNESWTAWVNGSYYANCNLGAKNSADSTLPNAISPIGTVVSIVNIYNHTTPYGYSVFNNSVYISAELYATLSNLTGKTIYYELAEPTTEQGTPFSENLIIDDFGTMSFEGTSGVPQGNLIFYPVDYKAYIDTLYDYSSGDPDNLALKTDVTTEATARSNQDTILQNAIGGTLRQCLCVKESLDFNNTAWLDLGELSYSNQNSGVMQSTSYLTQIKLPADNNTAGKILCSAYQVSTSSRVYNKFDNLSVAVSSTGIITVYDSNYTDVDQFKAAMKGVLLAYEKASE